MSNTMESLLELQHINIEGIDKITTQYQSIAANTKSKQYDVLDHRKKEVLTFSTCVTITLLILCFSLELCKEC